MDHEILELEDCPVCRGTGHMQHEGGWCVEVACMDCGAHTVFAEYASEAGRAEAEKTVARLWNMGKVIKSEPGE